MIPIYISRYIIYCGPKGGYRAYMGWGMWGKCAPCHPRSLEGCIKPPCHRSIHAVLHPVRRRCTGRLSSMNKRSVGHHTIQQLCTLHSSSTMMAVREDQYILIVSGAAHAPHHCSSLLTFLAQPDGPSPHSSQPNTSSHYVRVLS